MAGAARHILTVQSDTRCRQVQLDRCHRWVVVAVVVVVVAVAAPAVVLEELAMVVSVDQVHLANIDPLCSVGPRACRSLLV